MADEDASRETIPTHSSSQIQRLAVDIGEAGRLVSLGRSKIYSEIKLGHLRSFKIGTRTLIRTDELLAWIQSKSVEAK